MTPKNTEEPPEDESLGVLDDAASLDTTGIGILGGTAQVSVTLPTDDDDDLADDGVVVGEIVADLIIDDDPAEQSPVGRIHASEIVIEVPAEAIAPVRLAPQDEADAGDESTPASAADEATDEVAGEAVAEEADDTAVPTTQPVGPQPASAATADAAEPVLSAEPEPEQAEKTPASDATPPADGTSADKAADAEAEAAARFLAQARADLASAALKTGRRAAAPPARIQKESSVVTSPDEKPAAVPARTPRAEVPLASKRLDDLGEAARESADLLTADRLLDPARQLKPEPEGAWSHFLYTVSGHRINIGDSRRARERKALTAKIAAPLSGGARFVPVLSRKGGVGKTTITALLGMALADAREDRVIAVDANPDRGTLADRIVRSHPGRSVRDLVRIHDDVKGYHDISAIVARDATRLDVLASDADPRIAEAFSDSDYRDVADVAAHYYSLVLTDTGTGVVHSVMSATLDLADQIVIVSGLSVDEARLASETLTWLETNGYAEQAREAIVVLNQSTPGAPLVRLTELEGHFGTRAKHVVRVPYDPQIAGGGAIVFSALQAQTRTAARELAALLVDGLRAKGA